MISLERKINSFFDWLILKRVNDLLSKIRWDKSCRCTQRQIIESVTTSIYSAFGPDKNTLSNRLVMLIGSGSDGSISVEEATDILNTNSINSIFLIYEHMRISHPSFFIHLMKINGVNEHRLPLPLGYIKESSLSKLSQKLKITRNADN